MKMNSFKKKWFLFGIVYFTMVFILVPAMASAYIDPSVTTYAIQAIAGVMVAAGAFFATYGRRMKKRWMQTLDIDENETRMMEIPLEITREDLREELSRKRAKQKEPIAFTNKRKNLKGRIITSLLCGFAVALTIVLRPIVSFFYSNESEFWFYLEEIIGYVLILSVGIALGISFIHFLLPEKGKISLRLVFAAAMAALVLCVFIQNHFMSSYLPVLTGEPVDWSQYAGWGIASLVLWIGIFALFIFGTLFKARWFKCITFTVFILVLFTEMISGGVDILTAKHEREGNGDSFFSSVSLYDTSVKGNVVVFVSDTFEGTYMNEILEVYPEVRDLLPEVTYYDNTTGIGSMTYLSYTLLLTGLEFPMGKTEREGIAETFDEETLISEIINNGWDVAYYTDFTPTLNLKEKIQNYDKGHVKPNAWASWAVTKRLWKSSLFQSSPQQLKDHFLVYTNEYEMIKSHRLRQESVLFPFAEDDQGFYWTLKNKHAVTAVDNQKPRYILIQLWGLHDPCVIETDFCATEFDDTVSPHERKLKAGRAMMTLIREYLDQLKDEGTYDNTTVIMTADHGFNLRYYPVLLVKEAQSQQNQFRIDSTPLSLYEDFEPLMVSLTEGKTFSQAVLDLNISSDRERYTVDFRSLEGYSEKTDRRTLITINGAARDRDSYSYGNDEFLLNDEFEGCCILGESFILGGNPKGTVAVYGLSEGTVFGHSTAFDAFFDTKEARKLKLKIRLKNITENDQRIQFRNNEEIIKEVILPAAQEEEYCIEMPEKNADRWTIYMDTPDAEQRIAAEKVLPWVSFNSVQVLEAVFE